MSIFNKHKNGYPPQALETAAPAHDSESAARLREAAQREDWYEVHRLYRVGSKENLPADAVYPLARYLADENHPDEALELLQGFASRYPGHPDVVKSYVLAAHIMRRDFSDAAGARLLLENLAARYAEHPDYPLIIAQLEKPEAS